MAIQNRYEFVYLFDVANGNPNGDPDAANMPRLDPETSKGLVTDVCLKRKVRNFVEMTTGGAAPNAIYMQERSVLNRQHQKAYEAAGLKSEAKKLPKEEEVARQLTKWMCEQFYDIRSFGAVMTTEVNCGQVRGPVQMTFAQSIDPVIPQEISITRSSVTNQRDIEKERTMGRKYIIPYGLYRGHGFISAHLAGRTGFSDADLELFFSALQLMFDHDRSAARGEMSARRLIVLKHDNALGKAPAHKLFEAITVSRANGSEVPARSFADYRVDVNVAAIPAGVNIVQAFDIG
jgi:CRISPR-associated protein Csd2